MCTVRSRRSPPAVGSVKSFVAVNSIAVHNHFIEHDNTREADPLPDLADYRSPCDLTKRLAEDLGPEARRHSNGTRFLHL